MARRANSFEYLPHQFPKNVSNPLVAKDCLVSPAALGLRAVLGKRKPSWKLTAVEICKIGLESSRSSSLLHVKVWFLDLWSDTFYADPNGKREQKLNLESLQLKANIFDAQIMNTQSLRRDR